MSERRTALLEAAIAEIARAGTRGMRIDEVAKRAKVSPALIYHHFGDRSTLLQAALEYVGERADAYTSNGDGSAQEQLLALLVDEVQDEDGVRTNSAAWGELRDSAIFEEALRPTIATLTQRWVHDIAELIRAGHQDGSIDETVDPEELGVRLSALVEGISGRWLTGTLSTAEARDHIAAAAAALLRAPAPAHSPG